MAPTTRRPSVQCPLERGEPPVKKILILLVIAAIVALVIRQLTNES